MTNNTMGQTPHMSTEAPKGACTPNLHSGRHPSSDPEWSAVVALHSTARDCSGTPGAHTQCSLLRAVQTLRRRHFGLQQPPFHTIPERQPTSRTVLPGMCAIKDLYGLCRSLTQTVQAPSYASEMVAMDPSPSHTPAAGLHI